MKISVVIPCYNVSDFLVECLESVYSQTLQPAEVICVDNNSTDNTWTLLQNLKQQRFPNLILLQELRAGACFARNRGLELATAPWIQFLDADDLLLPNKLGHQAELLSQADCSGFLAGTYIRKSTTGKDTFVPASADNKWTAAVFSNAGITSSNLWNRKGVMDAGGWNVELKSSQEADLMLRMLLLDKSMISDPECLTIIRERDSGQISQASPGPRYFRFVSVRLNYLRNLKEQFPRHYSANKQELITCLVANLLILLKHDPVAASSLSRSIPWNDWKPAAGFGMASWKAILIKYAGWHVYSRLLQYPKFNK